MSNELKGAIDVLVNRVEAKTAELNNTKRMVNDLCREAGLDPLYSDADLATSNSSGSLKLRPDEFYGKAPMTAVRAYLKTRKQAVSLEELRDALQRGGFDFVNQKWPENAQIRNLAIGVSKNSKIFHRLPNDMIGLTEWYPNIKDKKSLTAEKTESNDAGTTDEADEMIEDIDGNDDAPSASAEGNKSDLAASFIPKLTDEDVELSKTAAAGHKE